MINFTKLSPTLTKNHTTWIKHNNYNYICSEHFIIKTNQDIKGGLLTKLVSLLGTIPQEEKGVQLRLGHIRELNNDEIKNMIELVECKNKKKIDFTNLLYQTDKQSMTIFKGDNYIFVNKTYIDIVNLYEKDIEIFGTTPISPIYFNDEFESMMVLPIRLGGEHPFYLKEF